MGCGHSTPLEVASGPAKEPSDKTPSSQIDISASPGFRSKINSEVKEKKEIYGPRSLSVESLPTIPESQAVHAEGKKNGDDYKRAFALAKKASFVQRKSVEEYTLEAVKERLRQEWTPEYKPEEIRPPMCTPDTISERSTTVTLSMLEQKTPNLRKTKIVCTMGPKCWSEEMLDKLIDNGMNVMRLNFSHGSHEAHLAVLNSFRKVAGEKGSTAAALLDTKGPEIRTAMLKDHKPLDLEANQEIIIEAVGEKYTEFEGYKTDNETRIGLSYGDLCKSMSPGKKILLADGTLAIEVLSILSDKELKGRVLNAKQLGERKNCNLPGVKVNLPILTEKDIDDLVNFACKHEVDFVAASFVQSASDVRTIREVLDSAGGKSIKIISKIENEEGLKNFDEILEITDGVMVARGDLGMEIPSEKVPVAQKMIITKCNIAGKVVICATQMLESMINNPLPTRAEMTDVANAVFDGVDGVMLSGETANGDFALTAVSTMAAIVSQAEEAVDYYSQYSFLRYWNTRGGESQMPADEATISNASLMAVLFGEGDTNKRDSSQTLVMCITETGKAANLVSKYRSPFPVVVISSNDCVLRQCSASFGQLAIKHGNLKGDLATMVLRSMNAVEQQGVMMRNCKVVVVHNREHGSADVNPEIKVLRTDVGSHHKGKAGPQLLRSMSGGRMARRGVQTFRSTRTNLELITKPVNKPRSTKILCTMGPKCWSGENLELLINAGLDIIRLNFSHGSHEQHLEVLQRFRKVCESKVAQLKQQGVTSPPLWASLLDTKGPEIRTAMLVDHKPIDVEAGQDIIVEAVGDNYVSFEGYKNEKETRIGLSYSRLCQSVVAGNEILIADGTLTIKVTQIISEKELRGTVLNSKQLGERKNCNLPGVKVLLPVLTDKDINDLKNFACKHHVDYVAASFVQSGDDVKFIRQVLREAGGEDIKIISKIENCEGLENFDQILAETDGVMVARGDLGMEIPAEKVPLAQKMLITKCNIAGKFVVTATQMLESMIVNPRPTRAEMTDIANAIIDGTDAVMLSGETANGAFPDTTVSTMAAICQNAEQMVTGHRRFDFLRNSTPKPMCDAEAVASAAVQTAMDIKAKAIACLTTSGRAARLVSKYRPKMPILVVSPNEGVIRQCRSYFGQLGILANHDNMKIRDVVDMLVADSKARGILDLKPTDQIVLVGRRNLTTIDDQRLTMRTLIVGDTKGAVDVGHTAYEGGKIVFYRSTKIGLDTILDDEKFRYIVRKTKIVCTMGPKCWSEESLEALLANGMNVARLNFSHGSHEQHHEVLERFRKVCQKTGKLAACLLDTKGPEIRTAMLKDHKPIDLEEGQEIILEAVGDKYTSFEGYKEEHETRIGLSYAKLCESVTAGNKILMADGTVSVVVEEILNDREVKGRVLNSKSLGERKNCNLPGVKVDLPVLTGKDIHDLQEFACKYRLDFVAASFVQTKADVQLIRKVLDEAGGKDIKIISKIENAEGLKQFDEILEVTDGVMIARGDLGMEIPVEKVPLAQKMMATKANIAGKFVICATQMLESMITSPVPTKAEITDVANAVFDGADAVMLSGETANGINPDIAVSTMAKICLSAELGVNYYQVFNYIREFTPKPVGTVEAVASTMAKNAVDVRPGMLLAFSEGGKTVRMISKYRPTCPLLVVTANEVLARQCSVYFSAHVMLLSDPIRGDIQSYVTKALDYAVREGLCMSGKEVLVLTSTTVANEGGDDDRLPQRETYCTIAPGALNYKCLGTLAPFMTNRDASLLAKTISLRSTVIDIGMLTQASNTVRKTKIMATLGPASDSDAVMEEMLLAGVNAARITVSVEEIEDARGTLQRFRKIASQRSLPAAIVVDLLGARFSINSLKDENGEDFKLLSLKEGDKMKIGQEGKCDDALDDGGIPSFKFKPMDVNSCLKQGDRLQHQSGLQFVVSSALGGEQFVLEALNSGKITELDVLSSMTVNQKNCSSMNAVRSILCEFKVEYIAVSACKGEIEDLRGDLSVAGLRILAKVDGLTCLKQADEIIASSDGIIISRDSLGNALGAHKVALAQNVLITRTNVAGKIAVLEGQILESMTTNLRPTRAEMTDVANAVFDGADCLLLGRETACGGFPVESIKTAHAIVKNAEQATNYSSVHAFVRDVSPKPFNTLEAAAAGVASACIDGDVALCIVVSEKGIAADLVAKYRPPTPQIVITTDQMSAAQAQLNFGQFAMLVPKYGDSINGLLRQAVEFGKSEGLLEKCENLAILHGSVGANADEDPVLRVVASGEI